jgi:hypothetical protein
MGGQGSAWLHAEAAEHDRHRFAATGQRLARQNSSIILNGLSPAVPHRRFACRLKPGNLGSYLLHPVAGLGLQLGEILGGVHLIAEKST